MTEDDKALVERLLDFLHSDDVFAVDWKDIAAAAERIEDLSAENERLQRSAEYWEQDAKRYAANQEHWRKEERAAIVAWLRENITPHNDIDEWADEIEAGVHLK